MTERQQPEYEVSFRVISFNTKDEAAQFLDKLTEAFCAMPEAEPYAAVGGVREAEAISTIAEKAEAVMPSMVAAIDLFKAKGLLRCASDAQQALDDLKAALAAAKGGNA